jgi:hypothetical protein
MLSICALIAIGCAMVEPKETTYLRAAQDRATQEEVRQRLGPPTLTAATQTGEALWVYQIRTQQPGNRMTAPGMWCDEYVLTFDDQAVLRRWTHRSYFHGGEYAPNSCVPGGYQVKTSDQL